MPLLASVSFFPPYIMVSVWPVYHLVTFFFLPLPFPRSPSPFLLPSLLPSSPQHLHRTVCPGQPLIIFTHQYVDQLHFMRIEKPQVLFCLDSTQAQELFQSVHQQSLLFGQDQHIKPRVDRGSRR